MNKGGGNKCPIMGFYSHDLQEGDIMTNCWIATGIPTLIKVIEIIERHDATGEWIEDFNKGLYVRAKVQFLPIVSDKK